MGLGIGLCSVPYFQCISGIFVHTLSPGSVAHLDGRLRYVLLSAGLTTEGETAALSGDWVGMRPVE